MKDDRIDRESGRNSGGGVLLMTTWNDGEAEMVRQILAGEGIPCQVVSDVPHSVLPISVDGLGELRIFVPGSRLDDARALIAEHLRRGLEGIPGGDNDSDPGDPPKPGRPDARTGDEGS